MYKLNQMQSHDAHNSGAMETETIQKNGARPKSQTSRGNFGVKSINYFMQL
ncbi:MAG: hypothetical protein LBG92_09730 [Prevotellaceae bacterium]|jgi:hypothetical protein|nr:hypothetical protein [Prevotellaceae bacterium]